MRGFICNKAGGKFYGDQLRKRLIAPPGTGTCIISASDIVPHRASGYEWENGALRDQSWVAPKLNITADNSLCLTAHDLARWGQALYSDKVLNTRIYTANWTPAKPNNGSIADYGYGWQRSGHRVIAHGGAWQGFRSQLNRIVDDKLTVIVLANSAAANPFKLANIVAGNFITALGVLPARPIADTSPDVTAGVRAAIASLTAGERPASLAPATAQHFRPETVAALSASFKKVGN